MRKYPAHGIWALSKAITKYEGTIGGLRRFIEQAVFAAVLILALSSQIATEIPYAAYLLLGLCSWFYLKEVLEKSVTLPYDFMPFMHGNNRHPFWLSFGIAVSALPTLLIWMSAALLVSVFAGLSLTAYYLIPYMILANFLNALAQSLTTASLAPLFPKLANTGLHIMLPIFFWTTPIAWQVHMPGGFAGIMAQLNPLYYLSKGMRGVVSSDFIPTATHTAIYLGVIVVVGIVGMILIKLVRQRALRVAE